MHKIVQFAALVLVLSFVTVAQSTQGLVAYYSFNGNANDASGNGNDGIIEGAVLTEGHEGDSARAYGFDSGSYIKVPSSPSLDLGSRFTITAWIKYRGGQPNPRIFSRAENNLGYEFGVLENWYGGVRKLFLHVGGERLESEKVLTTDSWHYVSVTMDSTTVAFYFDGILDVTRQFSGSVLPTSADGYIGRQMFNGFCDCLNGDIDELRIYNRSLSELEILSLYQGLVAYYPFDGNANDATPNKNDGVVIGPSLTTGQDGQSNSAYSFDGQDDYIRVPHSPSLNIDQDLTLSYWVKFQRVGSSSDAFYDWQCIVMKTSDGNSFGSMVGRNRELRFYHRDTTSTNSEDWYTQHEFSTLQASRWYHIALVYTGTTVFYYVNGEPVDSFSRIGEIIPNSTDMLIGRDGQVDGTPNWYPMEGCLDELRIYDRALSSNEIRSQFANEVVPGDVDGSGMISISDAVSLISFIFGGGPAPDPLAVGDANGDCKTNISDCVYLINYIFGGGSVPVYNPNCTTGEKKCTGHSSATLYVASSGKIHSVAASISRVMKALQLDFVSTGRIEDISITATDPRFQVFSGWVEGEYRVGLIDLTGKTTLPAGTHDLLTINYEGEGELVLNSAIVVDSDAQEMNVTISTSKTLSVLPTEFSLSQNRPNPFNPTTEISFSLPKPAEVNLTIYNILGEKVVTLTEGTRTAGVHTVTWDGRDSRGNTVASGVYFYRLDAGDFTATKKMLMMK